MAPSRIDQYNESDSHTAELGALKTKATPKQADMTCSPHPQVPPSVADNYMYDFKYNHPLPTTDVLGVVFPKVCDAQLEAEGIVNRLSNALGSRDADAFATIFLEYGEIPSRVMLLSMFLADNNRRMAGQAILHLGSTHIQLSTSNPQGR